MNVTLIAPRLPPATDGVGDHANHLALTLLSAGHEVNVVSAGNPSPAPYKIEVVGRTWSALATLRAVRALISHRGIALLEYTPFLFGGKSVTPLALCLAARFFRVPVGLIAHEAFYDRSNASVRSSVRELLFGLRDRATFRAARRVFVTDPRRRVRWATAAGGTGKVSLALLGANVEPFPGYRRTVDSSPPAVLLAFGVVSQRRRLELAIEAVAGLVKRGRDVRLLVVGRIFDQSYANSLFALAELSGIAGRLTLLGSVEADEVSHIMARSHLGVHLAPEGIVPSSGSLLAFLAHGVPTIAAQTKYDSPLLTAVVNAIPYSAAALEDAIVSALDDPAGAEQLGAAGQRAYRDAHTWPQAMGAVLDAMIGAES